VTALAQIAAGLGLAAAFIGLHIAARMARCPRRAARKIGDTL